MWKAVVCLGLLGMGSARSDTITLTGVITQDLNDSGGTAAANPGLNNIVDGDSFAVLIHFAGSLAASGNTTATSVTFEDTTVSVFETAFISGVVNVTPSASFGEFAVLACLVDPVSCQSGDQMDLNFQIPSSGLMSQTGVTVQPIPNIVPTLDLLEDENNSPPTEIQGSIQLYSYTNSSAVPEPFALTPVGMALLFLYGRLRRVDSRGENK